MRLSNATAVMRWVGDRHLLLSWAERGAGGDADPLDDPTVQVRHATRMLGARTPEGLVDFAPAETTILLTFDGTTLVPQRAEEHVRAVLAMLADDAAPDVGRLVEIPVCYAATCAPDIGDVARRCAMSEQQVADLHCGAEYTVRFLGFAPGFGYLAGLPKVLATPRLESPRTSVPAGSVGIADDRTGVYPLAMPGGWRLIGRTPLRLFDAGREPPATLRAGDRVRFTPITEAQFCQMMKGRQ